MIAPRHFIWTICRFAFTAIVVALVIDFGHHNNPTTSLASTDGKPIHTPDKTTLNVSNSTCPLQSGSDWSKFLKDAAAFGSWAPTCEDSECNASHLKIVKESILDTLARCPADSLPAKIRSCSSRLRHFVPAWISQHEPNSYGFALSSTDYMKYEEQSDKPKDMMIPPASLVAALPDLDAMVKVAVDHGWKYLIHDSAINNYRFFILRPSPDGRFDQWILVNLTRDVTIDTNQPLSVISIEKLFADGKARENPRIFFRDYDMTLPSLVAKTSGNGKCFSCHPSGPRQLVNHHTEITLSSPVRGEPKFNENIARNENDGWARLQEFNEILDSYDLPDWDGLLNPEHFGPALGTTQGCVDCHDGQIRGIISIATSADQLYEKIYNELAMVPDRQIYRILENRDTHSPTFTKAHERKLKQYYKSQRVVLDSVVTSKEPSIRAWLMEQPCE